jgi:glycosyltransferase involved in cell wall biosynthesis
MSDNALISVIMPVYNAEKFLRKAIDSILYQSFGNFEFIIVNDGSTDGSESIVKAYDDPRIRYVSQQNTGIGGALRRGCELALGVYIARMDADDICFPGRLAIQKKYLDCHPSVVLVSSAVEYINDKGDKIGRSFPYTSDFAIRNKLKRINPVCHPGVMMRTANYRRSIGYRDIQPFEDHLLWLSMAKQGRMHNFSFPLLCYRILNRSASRTITADQSKVLFEFLARRLVKGCLDDDAIKSYNELYMEEKKIALTMPANSGNALDSKDIKSITSQNQLTTYNTMKTMKLPEPLVEWLICNFKNTCLSLI